MHSLAPNNAPAVCRCCGNGSVLEVKELGRPPLCCDFGIDERAARFIERFPLGLGQCQQTGVIQVIHPVPAKKLVPGFSWIKNKEPEGHLPELASELAEYFSNRGPRVLLVSKFDETLGQALEEKIPLAMTRLDPESDLGIVQPDPGQALIQEAFHFSGSCSVQALSGQFDLVICCRMLEHSHQTHKFIKALINFLSPTGQLLIEIPDSTKSLSQGDVGMLWEEHTNYFTQESLVQLAKANGLEAEKKWVYEYPQEDALAVLFQHKDLSIGGGGFGLVNRTEFLDYGKKVEVLVTASRNVLEGLRTTQGDIVILGAGHRAIMFVNLLQIADLITAVIDDDDRKQGLFVPGTEIPIEPSSRLSDPTIGICLFAVGIELEQKLVESFTSRFARPLQYYSISPDSPLTLPFFH